jgi:gliding motility-associatede transport system auxiliary component
MKRSFIILTILGALLLLFGGMGYLVIREFNLVITWVVSAGIFSFALAVFLNYRDLRKVASERSTAKAFSSIIGSCITIAIVFLVYMMVARHSNTQFDWTGNRRNSLASQTIAVLSELAKKGEVVKVTCLVDSRPGMVSMAEPVLRYYREASDLFEYEIFDYVKHPDKAYRFGEKAKPGYTYVEFGGNRERMDWPISEKKLTNAIIKVTRNRKTRVYFTYGHGEHSLDTQEGDSISALKSDLEEQTYEVSPLNILQTEDGAIPFDCDVLAVAGPRSDFYPLEVDAIRRYLRKGGKALIMLDPAIGTIDPMNTLYPLLNEYGVVVEKAIIVQHNLQARAANISPLQPICTVASPHEITRAFGNTNLFVFSEASPLRANRSASFKCTTTRLLQTNPGIDSHGERNFQMIIDTQKAPYDDEEDIKGPLTVAIAVEAEVLDASGTDPDEMTRLVVVGDSTFSTNASPRLENRLLSRTIVGWLAKRSDQVEIPPKATKDTSLVLSSDQAAIITLIPAVVIPALVFFMAFIMWLWRRRYA